MENSMMVLLNTELRHIEASHLTMISSIIDRSRDWDRLLEELSKLETGLNLSLHSVSLIRGQLDRGKSPTLALLNHWAISGRRRPTLKSLLSLLHVCNLRWAQDYICRAILEIDPAERGIFPTNTSTLIDPQFKFDDLTSLMNAIDPQVTRYSFNAIYQSTNGFCHEPYDFSTRKGSKIGEGRFSSVFRATLSFSGPSEDLEGAISRDVAIKLLKSECNQKYLSNEVNLMVRVDNPNILKLLGVSFGATSEGVPQYLCLIYDHVINGSLFDCISGGVPSENSRHLNWTHRMSIANKVAQGISYLHNFSEGPIIHRDIKTANIFIDPNLQPKIGDFTLVRLIDPASKNETQYSQNVIGTSVYMPPEAFRGDISTKFDTFSYSIVLFELLSGLKPYESSLSQDLHTYINEKLSDIEDDVDSTTAEEKQKLRDQFLRNILDPKAGSWNFERAKALFDIAILASESRKKDRPEITTLLPSLQDACSGF